MSEQVWSVGDVIQIDPEALPRFGACFVVVAEVKGWGVVGYVLVPQRQHPVEAPIRLGFNQGVRIGRSQWIIDDRTGMPISAPKPPDPRPPPRPPLDNYESTGARA